MKANTFPEVVGYAALSDVLARAYMQAAKGKGSERHACQRPFTEQPMQTISDLLGSHTGLLYQAMKKIQESQRLDPDAAIRELLGAINYLAGAVIHLERKQLPLDLPLSGGRTPTPVKEVWECPNHDFFKVMAPVGEACPHCGATQN